MKLARLLAAFAVFGLMVLPAMAAEGEGGAKAEEKAEEKKGEAGEAAADQSSPNKTIEAFIAAMKEDKTADATKLVYIPTRKKKGAEEKAPTEEALTKHAKKIYETIGDGTVPEAKEESGKKKSSKAKSRTMVTLSNKVRVTLVNKENKWLISSASKPKAKGEGSHKKKGKKKEKSGE